MLGKMFGKHNREPIKVTASSLGSCETIQLGKYIFKIEIN